MSAVEKFPVSRPRVGTKKRKYFYTHEMNEYLKLNYKRTRESLDLCVRHLNSIRQKKCAELPYWEVRHQCQRLGICRTKEERWSSEQIRILKKDIASGFRMQVIARHVGRTTTACRVKARRIITSLIEARRYLTARDVEKTLGIEAHVVRRLIDEGKIVARLFNPDGPRDHTNHYVINYDALRTFVLNHPEEVFLPKCEKIFLFNLLSGRFEKLWKDEPESDESDLPDSSDPADRFISELKRATRPGRRRS